MYLREGTLRGAFFMRKKEVGAGCQSINDVADAAGEYKPEAAAPARRHDTGGLSRYSRDRKSKGFYDQQRVGDHKRSSAGSGWRDKCVCVHDNGEIGERTPPAYRPAEGRLGTASDGDNLMSLHHDTHSEIEQMYRKDKAGMIRKMQEMLKQFRQLKRVGGI